MGGCRYDDTGCCQKQAGYTIQGTVEGVADGDTVYLQNFENNNLVKIDSAIVKKRYL